MIRGYNLSDERVMVVYNGVNIERFHPRNRGGLRAVVRARYGIGPDVPVLLFVGAFERKGLAYAIEALSYMPSPRPVLLVAGSGRAGPHRRLAERFGVADRIVWAGQVSEVEQLYAAADIFLLPTLYDPFGLVVIEAMATGLPVITSRVAGVAEIIEHGVDGWLLDDPTDARQMAETICLLLADPRRSETMGERARDKACRYDWRLVSKQTESVYQRAVSRAAGKGEMTR
jgi:UDP-glucose:(heptosyl)LPS alpha-1,3-glucosyltransferase